MVDVKGTQSGIGKFFFKGSGLVTAHAWSRVQLQVIKALRPAMPLGSPGREPEARRCHVRGQQHGHALTGCTAPTLGSCTYALTGPTSSGILNAWSGSPSFTMPAANTNVGMRVSIGPANGDCSGTTTATATFTCYDYGANTGILAIRSFSLLRHAGRRSRHSGAAAGSHADDLPPGEHRGRDALLLDVPDRGERQLRPGRSYGERRLPVGCLQQERDRSQLRRGGCPNGSGDYSDMNAPPAGATRGRRT